MRPALIDRMDDNMCSSSGEASVVAGVEASVVAGVVAGVEGEVV